MKNEEIKKLCSIDEVIAKSEPVSLFKSEEDAEKYERVLHKLNEENKQDKIATERKWTQIKNIPFL